MSVFDFDVITGPSLQRRDGEDHETTGSDKPSATQAATATQAAAKEVTGEQTTGAQTIDAGTDTPVHVPAPA